MAGPGVAVVGTGFGARVHVPALQAAGFSVEALVGTDAERTRRRAAQVGVPRGLTSVDEALSLPGVTAVTIATPPDTHAPLVLEALERGRHVLCEKPFALDASEAHALCGALGAAGVTGLLGHEFRFATERAAARAALVAGAAGEARMATFVHQLPLLADPATSMPEWWFDTDRGGGWLGASGSHLVDQVHHWLGPITSVSASLSPSGRGADEGFTVLGRLEAGGTVLLQQHAAAWGPPLSEARVIGDLATIWLDGEDAWIAGRGGTRPLAPPDGFGRDVDQPASEDPRHRFTHLELGPYTRLCRAFRTAIETGDVGEAATFEDGLATQRVLDAIRRAARDEVEVAAGEPP